MKTITHLIYSAVAPFALASFALSPAAQATCQEGCLTNQSTVLGEDALFNNIGINNTASSFNALYSNTTGGGNTANGAYALYFNTTGKNNIAVGFDAGFNLTIGINNTASGFNALYSNTTGGGNTANGAYALYFNTTGKNNIAVGFDAGFNLTSGNNNIDIGNLGVAGEARTIRIGTSGSHGATFIAGISGATVPNGVGVIVGPNGQLGTVVSSERFKDEIQPMDTASEAILALKPVTFRYKHDLDPEGIP